MTHDEWEACSHLLENCWRGDWDEARADAYFTMLKNFDGGAVLAAIQRQAENPKPFIPAVPEIVAEVRKAQEPPLPSWAEAWALIRRALGKENPVEWLNGHHEFLGAFVALEGVETLRMTPFFDPDYGELRIKNLGERWEQFCERGIERVRSGRAIEARTGDSQGQPTRLNAGAALGLDQKRPALPAGSDG